MWRCLRNRRIATAKFRRQAPIGPYIADFVSFARHLIVELDGGQHAATIAADTKRTVWLQSQGFRVLRFWNNDVIENIDGVLLRIIAELESQTRSECPSPSRRYAPGPSLSHKGRGD